MFSYSSVQYLLQQQRDRLFMREIGIWTDNPKEAHRFRTALTAFIFSMEYALADVEVVELPGAAAEIAETETADLSSLDFA